MKHILTSTRPITHKSVRLKV
uniref:Uncharacterized protein n=1 Tax=Rhizophora mucronata TaxID=61149 RepID=A0A2P2PSU2_RHIMU